MSYNNNFSLEFLLSTSIGYRCEVYRTKNKINYLMDKLDTLIFSCLNKKENIEDNEESKNNMNKIISLSSVFGNIRANIDLLSDLLSLETCNSIVQKFDYPYEHILTYLMLNKKNIDNLAFNASKIIYLEDNLRFALLEIISNEHVDVQDGVIKGRYTPKHNYSEFQNEMFFVSDNLEMGKEKCFDNFIRETSWHMYVVFDLIGVRLPKLLKEIEKEHFDFNNRTLPLVDKVMQTLFYFNNEEERVFSTKDIGIKTLRDFNVVFAIRNFIDCVFNFLHKNIKFVDNDITFVDTKPVIEL